VHAAGLDLRGLRVLVLSIMFLLTDTAISASISGSSHVWQKVARFCRALPSSITSSATTWYASRAGDSSDGKRYLGTSLVRSCPTNTHSSSCSRTVSRSCNGITARLLDRNTRPVILCRGIRCPAGGGTTRHAGCPQEGHITYGG